MAVGYDSTEPQNIPDDIPEPDYVFGYVNGDWPSYDAICARYPRAIHVPISAVAGSPDALTAIFSDGERGDYSPEESAIFSSRKIADNVFPGCYCSYSNWPKYEQAHIDIGILPAHVDWWIADYPGTPGVYVTTVAHQYADMGTYDVSIVIDNWVPGRSISSTPPPIPVPTVHIEESGMITRNTSGRGYWAVRPTGLVYAFDGAPDLGPTPAYLAEWGIGTPTNPVVGITDDGEGGFILCADADNYPGQPALYHIDASGQYAK